MILYISFCFNICGIYRHFLLKSIPMEKETERETERRVSEYFWRNDISAVAFDMDDTLTRTNDYYRSSITGAAYIFLRMSQIEEDLNPKMYEIYTDAVDIFRGYGLPQDITDLTLQAILRYRERHPDIVPQSIENFPYTFFIKDFQRDFYLNSPEVFEDTPEILHIIRRVGIPIYIHSHASWEWTGIKVARIQEEIYRRYKMHVEIPFFASPTDRRKDTQAWLQAGEYLGIDYAKTLIVGDSMQSDILAAQEAGAKRLVHINSTYSRKKLKNKGYRTARGIGELFVGV